jgi:hypothetical protein
MREDAGKKDLVSDWVCASWKSSMECMALRHGFLNEKLMQVCYSVSLHVRRRAFSVGDHIGAWSFSRLVA